MGHYTKAKTWQNRNKSIGIEFRSAVQYTQDGLPATADTLRDGVSEPIPTTLRQKTTSSLLKSRLRIFGYIQATWITKGLNSLPKKKLPLRRTRETIRISSNDNTDSKNMQDTPQSGVQVSVSTLVQKPGGKRGGVAAKVPDFASMKKTITWEDLVPRIYRPNEVVPINPGGLLGT